MAYAVREDSLPSLLLDELLEDLRPETLEVGDRLTEVRLLAAALRFAAPEPHGAPWHKKPRPGKTEAEEQLGVVAGGQTLVVDPKRWTASV